MNTAMAKRENVLGAIDGGKGVSSQAAAKKYAFNQRKSRDGSDNGFGATERSRRGEVSNTAARQAARIG